MLVRIYWSLWALFLATSVIWFAAGGMSSMVLVVFGLIAFGLTFMGMMGVLPAMVSHPSPPKEAKTRQPVEVPARRDRPAKAFGTLKSA